MSDSIPDVLQPGILTELHAAAAESGNLDERGIPKKLGRQFRRVEKAAYDKDTHTVTMAVSSSTPVERYFGAEILSHDKGAMRTDRLSGGVSLLFNHDYDQLLGRSQSFEMGNPIRVTARFGTSDLALEKEKDVEAEILVDVSIGYQVYEWEITEDKNGVRTYLAVDWEILEVSLVTVPADPTVGVGRDAKDGVPVKVRSFTRAANGDSEANSDEDDGDENDDEEDNNDSGSEPARTTQPTNTRSTMPPEITANPAEDNKTRIEGLRLLLKDYSAHFTVDDFTRCVTTEVSVRDAREAISDKIIAGAQRSNVPTIGDSVVGDMNHREQKEYSMVRALRSAINQRFAGTFKEDADAGFEREISDELRKRALREGLAVGGGLLRPSNLSFNLGRAVQAARAWGTQEMQERTMSAGGAVGSAVNFTTTETTAIELLRARTRCTALGAQMLSGLSGILRMPRQNAASQSSWLAEGTASTDSGMGFDDITLTPHRLGITGSYYMELLAQSALAIEDLLRADQTIVEALSLDFAALAGTGANNIPLGLLNQSGLAAILPGSTRSASGVVTPGLGAVSLTYVDINLYESIIATANADAADMGWMFTPKVRGALRSTPKFPNGVENPIYPESTTRDPNGIETGPLGYKCGITTQLPQNNSFTPAGGALTTGLHAGIFGDWSSMIFADWGIRELIVDNITQAKSGMYIVTENSLHDTNVRHIEKFVASQCIYPS